MYSNFVELIGTFLVRTVWKSKLTENSVLIKRADILVPCYRKGNIFEHKSIVSLLLFKGGFLHAKLLTGISKVGGFLVLEGAVF